MTRIHVIKATVDPSAAPAYVGQHYINTTTSTQWLSKGTSSVADWVDVTSGGGFSPTITSPQSGDVIYYNGSSWVNIASEDIVADFTTLIDEVDATTTYVGYAQPGTSVAAASWKIKQITTSGNDLEVEYADGVKTFTKTWNDRATYTYS